MPKKIALTVLSICLIASLSWGFITSNENNQLQAEWQAVEVTWKAEVAKWQAEWQTVEVTWKAENAQLQQDRDRLWQENIQLQAEVVEWQIAYEQKPSVVSNLREFHSEQELKDWLAVDRTDLNKYVPNQFDCEDFARMLQGNALSSGYIVSIALTQQDSQLHAINVALIGNKLYWIEPQTDQFSFWGYTD